MKLKLSEWASLAEVVSGIAVLVTLVFLIMGIRENTDVTRASMYDSSLMSLNDLERTAMADPDLLRVYMAWVTGQAVRLEGDDRNRLSLLVVAQFRVFDSVHSRQRYGLLGESEWQRFRPIICTAYGRAQEAGLELQVTQMTSSSFSEYVETAC